MGVKVIGDGDYKLIAWKIPGYTPATALVRVGLCSTPMAIDYARHRLASGEFEVFRISDGVRVFDSRSEGEQCPRCGGVNGGHGLVHRRYDNGGGGNVACPATVVSR